jgi:hypothetical protein
MKGGGGAGAAELLAKAAVVASSTSTRLRKRIMISLQRKGKKMYSGANVYKMQDKPVLDAHPWPNGCGRSKISLPLSWGWAE